jgi:hypothetical protein
MDSQDEQVDNRRRGVYIPRDVPSPSISSDPQTIHYSQHQQQLHHHHQQQLLSKTGIALPTSIPKPLPLVPHRVSVQQQPMHYQPSQQQAEQHNSNHVSSYSSSIHNYHHSQSQHHHQHQPHQQQSFSIQAPRASLTNNMIRIQDNGASHSEKFNQQYDPIHAQYYNNHTGGGAYQQSFEINNQVPQNSNIYNNNSVNNAQSATNSHESYNNVSGINEKKSRSPKITSFFVDHIFNVRAQLDKDMEGVKNELERLLHCYGIGKENLILK